MLKSPGRNLLVAGTYRIVYPQRRRGLVLALELWISLAWWIEQWFGSSTQSSAVLSSNLPDLISAWNTLASASRTGSYSLYPPPCVRGFTRMQPFSGVDWSIASQTVTTSIGSSTFPQ